MVFKVYNWVYRTFIRVAFDRGHRTKNEIRTFVSRRLDMKCKNLFQVEKWSLGNVAEYFLAYGAYLKPRLEDDKFIFEVLFYKDLIPQSHERGTAHGD